MGIATALATASPADAQAWVWSAPFNHNEEHRGDETQSNPYLPWGGVQGAIRPQPPQAPMGQPDYFYTIPGTGSPLGWPRAIGASGTSFNAVHMALIPKGRYRGMVLVWTTLPVLGRHPANPPAQTTAYTSFQPYSIIDPADALTVTDPLPGGAQTFRYRNFLLPVEFPAGQPVSLTPTPFAEATDAFGLFCSGHAWSSFGDLVVVGGTDFDLGRVSDPPPGPPPGWQPVPYLYAGTRTTYVFNPRFGVAAYPGTTGSMYPGFQGLWQPGPNLVRFRWYPTATLTHRIQRAPASDRELMLVLGGSRDDNNDPYWDTPGNNPQWNDYEAFIIQGESTPVLGANIGRDVYNGVSLWLGPGTVAPPLVEEDWFEEYPRCHLLSTGEILFSGYAPRWATLDPEVQGAWVSASLQIVTGTGAFSWGAYTSNWFDPATPGHVGHPRHDGTSLLFPNLGGARDIVMRIGGADGHFYSPLLVTTTPTVETLKHGGSGQWEPAPSMPSTHPAGSGLDGGRVLANAVILPTGAVLVLGGDHYLGPGWGSGGVPTHVYSPVVFDGGKWAVVPPNPTPSVRDYHSTAVLLDDGRIFIGGGESRDFDYEILSPPYMSMVRPENLAWQAPLPAFDPQMEADRLDYHQPYNITCDRLPVGVAVDKVVLTAPCSITHHSDMHQRYFELKTTVNNANEVQFDTPDDDKCAPAGLYMLWLVTNTGVPSKAMWVVLR